MTEVTLMVTGEVADALAQLAITGRLKSVRGRKGRARYTAFCLAGYTRPMKGERWIKIGLKPDVRDEYKLDGVWHRLPERYSFGG